MDVFIGIDDTDNKDSRGTGYLSRKLAGLISDESLGHVTGITRHQLLIHPAIPYTSQNSSACLIVDTDRKTYLTGFCRDMLLKESARGSDVGLCIAEKREINQQVINWGLRAKKDLLNQDNALMLADKEGIYLEGLIGEHTGVVGALAAVGLRKSGNDGRFIWLEGQKELRDILPGYYLVEELTGIYNFDVVISKDGSILDNEQMVYLGDWVRPLLKDNKITLVVENGTRHEWEIASKEYIRAIS